MERPWHHYCSYLSGTSKTDRAKPRLIGGRKTTDPVLDSRVARVDRILEEPVIHVDLGLFVLIENKREEVDRL